MKKAITYEQPGYIPEPTDTSHLKGKKVSKKALEAEVQGVSYVPAEDAMEITYAPATYDLRTSGRVSPVKNQGSCGSCWAFATYGSMESEALPGQLFDFSENNLKNTHGFDPAACAGGNAQMATAYLARWSGAVAEANDPYVATSTTSPTGLPVQEHAQEILTIPGRSGPLDNDNIKAALQTTGALYTTMFWSSSYYNSSSGAYYYSGNSGSNHAVTIIGWDDTYSKNNFLTVPPGDGAFIIKNSWGTTWGKNGYFYLSYYDSKAGKSVTAFTGESATNYNHIYQYDPLGWLSSMGFGSNTAWAANVFTATSQEVVSAVGITTNQLNTAYQISIYTNPTQGPLNSAGPATTVQGTIGIPGYHTIPLPIPVTVQAGEKFSVVVKFQTPDYNYPVAIERPVSGYASQVTASTGQSYISTTGTSWTDLVVTIPNANACIKAYTVYTASAPTITVIAPNGGESWVSGSGHEITWTSSGTAGSSVKIEVLKGGTVVQTLSSSTPNDGSFSWTISTGLASGSDYRIRITSTTSATITDMSNTYFTIAPAGMPVPVASFTGTPTSGKAPLTVFFRDASTNSPTSWYWIFGDGGTSTLTSPSHTYTTAGTYTVTLRVSNPSGSNTLTRTGYIRVQAGKVRQK